MGFLKNPRIKYEVVTPDGTREYRAGEIAGYVTNADKIKSLLLHTYPPGTQIENLRQVDSETGDEIPEQPDVFKTPEQRAAAQKRASEAHAARAQAAAPPAANVTKINATLPAAQPE